ncbi:MAG: hypothetical protein ACRC8S_19215 [Fimbriiglobus sp.]
MNPLPASTALDAYFLEARCKLLDLAAILDRIQRGSSPESVQNDPRLAKIATALAILQTQPLARAQSIQELFSLPYDPTWPIPMPKETAN